MLPPGLRYILTVLPSLVAPSLIIGASLFVTKTHFNAHALPTWSILLISAFAHSIISYITDKLDRRTDQRAAKANNAVLPPLLNESSLSIVSKLTTSIRSGYPGDTLAAWAKEYGKNYLQIKIFSAKMFYTTEPDHIKAILATQFDSFEKGAMFNSQMDSLLGQGIFNADGEMWKFHRAITRPFFTKERISDFDIYTRNCDKSLEEVRNRLAEGYPVDIQDLIGRFTLDSASEFLFGHNVGSLSAGIPYPSYASHKNTASFHSHPSIKFQRAFNEGQFLASIRTGAGEEWRLLEFWRDNVEPLRKDMDSFTEPMMREALEAREKRLNKPELGEKTDENTLLAHLVNHTQDPKILKDELINLLVAGRDTTMSLLTFGIYSMIQNPALEHKLRSEILEKVGARNYPTYDNMRDMKYTRAFLNGERVFRTSSTPLNVVSEEVLLLYPSVPLDTRVTNKPVVLSTKKSDEPPIYLPAKTTAVYSVLYMHRRTDLWGPDALTFDPDRFLDERLHKYLTPNPFIFCPFNAGPRICLGQQFAYHEATFYLIRLLQNFTNFKFVESENQKPPESWKGAEGLQGTDRIVPMIALTMSVKGGLWITMDELKNDDA
ncbi:cytochrome P450 monooxygenase pc-1 [Panaeolus papilionaceus]|nr:cytochrome P450 monooxygenase pc-1 [Panaeolus papilionaceus]